MPAPLFIVIEGLDGSGKTSVARQLAYYLQATHKKKVKLTFEPHDPSCAGLFIRQILEKKIKNFSPETLMLAFAANRMDHCDREINRWLNDGDDHIVICDRYYLSSLVYQSTDGFTMSDVMEVNKHARKPDLTFFLDVSNKACYERMKVRNKPKELFEQNLSSTRKKYEAAISFLASERDEKIITIDASGTIESVLFGIVEKLKEFPSDLKVDLFSMEEYKVKPPKVFTLNGTTGNKTANIVSELESNFRTDTDSSIDEVKLKTSIDKAFSKLDINDQGYLFLEYLQKLGYSKKAKLPWTHLDAYKLSYDLPGGVPQRGTALLVSEHQRYDVILDSISKLDEMTDFMFVFAPGQAELITQYYERDITTYGNKRKSLFPSTILITEEKLKEQIFEEFLQRINV